MGIKEEVRIWAPPEELGADAGIAGHQLQALLSEPPGLMDAPRPGPKEVTVREKSR